jgi:cobalt-zinc-cadmium efflux system protein
MTLAVFMLWQSLSLLKPTVSILKESVPADLDIHRLVTDLSKIDRVIDLHHIHIWELDEEHRALEAHVTIAKTDMDRMTETARHTDGSRWGFGWSFEVSGNR